jgi:hypothetical protein
VVIHIATVDPNFSIYQNKNVKGESSILICKWKRAQELAYTHRLTKREMHLIYCSRHKGFIGFIECNHCLDPKILETDNITWKWDSTQQQILYSHPTVQNKSVQTATISTHNPYQT